ncbi:MAG TPA: hypothetical protein VHP32_01775 [Ignavibacteria bacterium]|nr:hypothetical protein [Ignavibacteria bacterium]
MQIIKSRISFDINSLLSNVIHRNFLLTQLIHSKQFTLITAPSGFGKTLLIAQFLKKEKIKFSYYELSESDKNLYVFLHYFLYSINDNPEKFKEEINLIESNKLALSKYTVNNYPLIESILSGIFEKIAIPPNQMYFCSVIENIDLIKKELWFKSFIKAASKFAKSKIKFIFTGIHIPESLFIPSILNGQFSLIDKNDFELSTEEINNFSDVVYNHKNSIEECEQIKELIGGWISGLHLFFHSGFSKPQKNFTNRKIILFEYFNSEILSNISSNEKALLFKLSFLNEINEDILKHLIKNAKGSETLHLLSKKIPFLAYEEGNNYFYFSGLFKEFLNKFYNEEEPAKNKKDFFNNCAKYYERKENYDAAFEFYEKSGNHKKLIEIITENSLQMYRNSEFYIVSKWINTLDKKILFDNKEVLYIYALLLKNYLEEREKSNELFLMFLKKSKPDNFTYYKAIAHIAENFIYLKNYNKASENLKKYLKKAPQKFKPIFLFRLHSVNYAQYNFEKCSSYLQEALDILSGIKNKDSDNISLRNSILNALGNIFFLKGNFHKSIHFYNQVLEFISNEYNKFETRLNLCEVNSKLGNFENAYGILSELERQDSLSQLPELRNKLKQNFMLLKYEEGKLNESLEIADELSASSDGPDENTLLLKLKIYFILNDKTKIKNNLHKEEKFFKNNEILNLEFQILKNLFINKFQNLKSLLDKLKSFGLVLKEIELYSIIIFYLIRTGRHKAAEEYLNILQNLNSKTKYTNIMNSFLSNDRSLYDTIMKLKIYPKYFNDLYLEIHNNQFDFYDIKVKYFGVPEIYFRGAKLADTHWKRNKFKDIFLYLYFNISKRISKEELLERFYPDADKNYADNIFHQFLSNMRSVFSEMDNNAKLEFILYKNKIFELNPNYIFTSDVKILEKIIKEINTGENKNLSYLKKNYNEPFMKNYYDEFAENQREYYANVISKLLK